MVKTARILFFAVALSLVAESALAAIDPPSADPTDAQAEGALRQDYDAAFRAMLANPSDLDLTFRYAELAAAIGDIEGAIGAYERLLLLNPNLPHVQLALGELYLKLDSTQAARVYLEAARDNVAAPPETRKRASDILASLDEANPSRHRFVGYLQLGGTWQSNASNGATAARIRSFGVSVVAPKNSRETADYGAVLSGDLTYSADLGDSGRSSLENHARFYLTRQLKVSSVNLGVLQVDSGPRFLLGADVDGASLRPYVTAGLIGLADQLFQWNGGGGVAFSAPLDDRWSIHTDLSERGQFYTNSTAQPTASDANGAIFDGVAAIRFDPTVEDTVRAGPSLESLDARVQGQRYNQYGIQLGWQHSFAAPWGWSGQPWSYSMEGNRLWRDYARPDPTVDPAVTRADREWNLDVSLTVPISDAWVLVGDVSQQWVTSNLANYRFSNTTVALSVGVRF
jgi:hypothetical protein